MAIVGDVADEASAGAAIAKAAAAHGAARVLVNCAGVGVAKRVVGRDGPHALTDFEKVIRVNLIGSFNMIRLAAAEMGKLEPIDGERGVIISTASVAAYEGQIGQAAYSASKGGVVAMTLPIAREFAQFGIRVNAIAPGIFMTPMLFGLPQAAQDLLGASVPFPPRLGQPAEYAALAVHIVENGYINGETIRIDGALRMAPNRAPGRPGQRRRRVNVTDRFSRRRVAFSLPEFVESRRALKRAWFEQGRERWTEHGWGVSTARLR